MGTRDFRITLEKEEHKTYRLESEKTTPDK